METDVIDVPYDRIKHGLSSSEAGQLLEKHGLNVLPEKPPPSDISIFVSQLKNPLVYVLLIAGVVTFLLEEFADTSIIALAVFINTVLGFFQERKANKALEALKKLVHPEASVIRDGRLQKIGIENLVPGDVVVLNQGDKVPADGVILEANRTYLTEAILTGESVPIAKERGDEVYMGTIVTSGRAKMVVRITGAGTEMGKIALSVIEEQEATPLKKQLEKFSHRLSLLVLFLLILILGIGLLAGDDPVDIFLTSVALAVSAIPEGLLVAMTAVLAIGMQRILGRKGLVRNLVSAETLGGVTTICVDKTGTLTQGKMQVVDTLGDEDELSKQVVIANDLDDPIVIAAWEWGEGRILDTQKLNKDHERLDSLPFSSKEQLFASLNRWSGDNNIIFVNGAPEVLMDYSNLSDEKKAELTNEIARLTSEGKRMLGFVRKLVANDKVKMSLNDVKKDFEWVGMLAFTDPVRPDIKEAFEKTRMAGIKLVVITGDYAGTAISVVRQLGMDVEESDVILGKQVEEWSNKELEDKLSDLDGVKIFARTKPDQKLKIVDVLKHRGEVVAMMGDGVNDAPALSRSDIGIVVGEASDVAKESADLVLLDSSFSTIVAAIEEGRGIFANIRKIILYLMSDAFEEILLVLAVIILGNVYFGESSLLPITAAQILWVNLISDGFPNLALTIDPKPEGIMSRPPRSPKEFIVAPWMYGLIGVVSVVGGVFAFVLFTYVYKTTGNLVLARSVTFATVGVNSLVYVFSIRTLTKPFWKSNALANRWLILAVGAGLSLQVLPFVYSGLRKFLDIEPIGYYWFGVFGAAVLMFLSIEVAKWVIHER